MPDKSLKKGGLKKPRRSQKGRKARERSKSLKDQAEVRLKNLEKARRAKKKKAADKKKNSK